MRQLILLFVALYIGSRVLHVRAQDNTYTVIPRAVWNDLEDDCGQTDASGNPVKYCRICGGVRAVAAACDKRDSCKSFDMEAQGNGGYLKSKGGPTKGTTYNNNYYNFCKVNGAPISGPDACDGAYTYHRRKELIGWNINCGYKNKKGEIQSYCPARPYLSNWLDACSSYDGCQAVQVGPAGNGPNGGRVVPADDELSLAGLLTRRPGPLVDRDNYDVFVRTARKR